MEWANYIHVSVSWRDTTPGGTDTGDGSAGLRNPEKHLFFFKLTLQDWKKEIVKSNNEALYNGSIDNSSVSADMVDQASTYTDKNVEMKAINRQIKLISKIDKALLRIKDNTYGFCAETAEPIGLKRLIARPVADLCIAAQEKHEKEEKVYADD